MQKFRTYDVSISTSSGCFRYTNSSVNTRYFSRKNVTWYFVSRQVVHKQCIRTREYVHSFKYPKCD